MYQIIIEIHSRTGNKTVRRTVNAAELRALRNLHGYHNVKIILEVN